MPEFLRSDIYCKDADSVEVFRSILGRRLPMINEEGGRVLYGLVDQDDPLHLMFLEQWESRGHFNAYMRWASEQPDRSVLGGLLCRAPVHVWLAPLDD